MPNCRIAALLCACLAGLVACCPETSPPAAPKTALDCIRPSTTGAAAVPTSGVVSGGTYSSPGPVTLSPGGAQFALSSDLVISSDDDLTVDIDLDLPWMATPGAPQPNITLMARRRVVINRHVGGGTGGQGAVASGTFVKATPGGTGGHIKIVAGTIDLRGQVEGGRGGRGGTARAIGIMTTAWGGFLTSGGEATAVGGSGGMAGDVILCADLIVISGSVSGGEGGTGGFGIAAASAGHDACGCGGAAAPAGDVIFGPGSQINISGTVSGGGNGNTFGGHGIAYVTGSDGGDADAHGGASAPGGTVLFRTGAVVFGAPPPVALVKSGAGGIGGYATARGGTGANGRLFADAGGMARAFATAGGKFGATPQIPQPNGSTVPGTDGPPGPGGGAEATGGTGGTSTWGVVGGSSGISKASGGSNGNGVPATGGVPSAGPAAATGAAGAAGLVARQDGAP
jgi:hypothetical protein